MPTIYLDCDGVLADFDTGAANTLAMHPRDFERRHGLKKLWEALAATPHFFERLPLLPDAMELYEAVKHTEPVILTGLPRGSWAAPQKVRWAARYFPGVEIITTNAALKREHCHPGDALVDDRTKYAHLWEDAGGVFIHHRDARRSIEELKAKGFI